MLMLTSSDEMKEPWSLPPDETWSEPLTNLTTMTSMEGESSLLKTKIRRVADEEDPEAGPDLDPEGQGGQDPRDPDPNQDPGPREEIKIQNQDLGPSLGIVLGPEEEVPSLGQDPNQGTEVDLSLDPDQESGKIQNLDQDQRKDQNQVQTRKRGPSLDLTPTRGQDQNPSRENSPGPDQSLQRKKGLGPDLNQPRMTDPGQNLDLVQTRDQDQDLLQTEETRDLDQEVLSKKTRKRKENLLHRMVTALDHNPNLQKGETRLTMVLMINMQPHLKNIFYILLINLFIKYLIKKEHFIHSCK